MRPRGVGGGGVGAAGEGELSTLSPPLAHLPLGRDLSRYSLKRRAYLQVKSREINVAARLLNRPGHLKCTINMDDLILILGTIQGATGMLVKHGFIRTLVYLFIYLLSTFASPYFIIIRMCAASPGKERPFPGY